MEKARALQIGNQKRALAVGNQQRAPKAAMDGHSGRLGVVPAVGMQLGTRDLEVEPSALADTPKTSTGSSVAELRKTRCDNDANPCGAPQNSTAKKHQNTTMSPGRWLAANHVPGDMVSRIVSSITRIMYYEL